MINELRRKSDCIECISARLAILCLLRINNDNNLVDDYEINEEKGLRKDNTYMS